MSYQYNDPANYGREQRDYGFAVAAEQSERIGFIRKTYAHLAGAVLAFVALELAFFLATDPAQRLTLITQMFGNSMSVIILMVAFIGGGYLAQWWASNASSRPMQYAGLALYVLIEAVIFLPILTIAADYGEQQFGDKNLIGTAGVLTGIIFAGLTIGVFATGKDFSFLGGFLWIAGFLLLGVMVCGYFFGYGLGMWFSAIMIGFACMYILYDTSNVMRHYRTDQYVAAALALFASVALLFFYILRLLMQAKQR